MTKETKGYITIGAGILAMIALISGIAGWSNYKIGRLEADVADAKRTAEASEHEAMRKESEAAGYRQKIAYLETQLGETKTSARKQDEKLEKLNSDSRRVRVDADRARGTRVVPADTRQLCEKLAELGHPCSE